MNRRTALGFAALAVWGLAAGHVFAQDLARSLATPELRDAAVESIAASRGKDLPLLLAWGEKPPSGVDPIGLNIGLAEAFGRLRAPEGVLFLIRNISLDASGLSQTNTWMKADSVVEARLPAMMALIAIGPDASNALLAVPWDNLGSQEQMPALYAICKIADPGARGFLMSFHAADGREARLVQEGLRMMADKSKVPAVR